jgi:hypothetical protein
MRNVAFALAGMLFMVSMAAPAYSAPNVVKWKKIGPWEVLVDRTLKNSCFIFAVYRKGTVLRIGFTENANSAYIALGNKDWKSIEAGKEYDLKFQFDRLSPWFGTASAKLYGKSGFPMLFTIFSKASFLKEFGRKHGLLVSYKTKTIASLKLRGSKLALDELINCQSAMRSYSPGASLPKRDPFSGVSQGSTKDPFQ